MRIIECLPISLQASRSFLKEGHSGKARGEAKALGESHALVGNIYKICYSSTEKRSGATMEDVTRVSTRQPNTATRTGDGPGQLLQAGCTRTTCCARYQEASSRIGIESGLP